jgi:hypothetical protein
MSPGTLLIAFTCACITATGQRTVEGRVLNARMEPQPDATIMLLKAGDSSLVKGTIADKQGFYSLDNIVEGEYFVSASRVGYQTNWSAVFSAGKDVRVVVPDLILQEGHTLGEVVVKGTKSLFELKPDRIVMNVSSSPVFSGNSALEVLEKTPGVTVNKQLGSIGISGKGEVIVMINERIQRIPVQALIARLEGMRAENIRQIEIIQQPPARYDASGAAGMIHIVLKENEKEGTNATMTLMAGYGQGPKGAAGITFNSRKGKLNWYGGYNASRYKAGRWQVDHFREYDYSGDIYYHSNYVRFPGNRNTSHSINTGIDLALSEKTQLAFEINATTSRSFWGINAPSDSYDYLNGSRVHEQHFRITPGQDADMLYANGTVEHRTGPQSRMRLDLNYVIGRFDNTTRMVDELHPAMSVASKSDLQSRIISVDRFTDLGKNWKMEMGVKGSFNSILTSISGSNFRDGSWLKSGKDDITERILAAYVSTSGKLSTKLQAEAGIRYEDFHYQLEAQNNDDLRKSFRNVFPILRLHFQLDTLNSLQLSVNRSIARPSFWNLTAFIAIFDSSLLLSSNPRLRPAFTNTWMLTYQRKNILLTFAYLQAKGTIFNLNTVDKPMHLQTMFPTNLDKQDIFELTLIVPLSITPWWKINSTLTGRYQDVEDASSHSIPYQNSIYSYFAQVSNLFRVGKGWTISLDGRSQSWILYGDQEQLKYPWLGAGIQKRFSNGDLLALNAQDLFETGGKTKWEYNQPAVGIRTFGLTQLSERQVSLTYTHVFGNKKLAGKRERKTGSEEVRSRM